MASISFVKVNVVNAKVFKLLLYSELIVRRYNIVSLSSTDDVHSSFLKVCDVINLTARVQVVYGLDRVATECLCRPRLQPPELCIESSSFTDSSTLERV